MVCVPCIILPFLLAIYLKFIQPYILRMLPETWRTKLDEILYPTCPLRQQQPAKKDVSAEGHVEPQTTGPEGDKKTD